MWTAVILVCASQACHAVGGPIMPSRETCEFDLRQYGVAYIAQRFPNAHIADMKCVEWGEPT
mgnify:FL=1|jgi:hypothetical protein